MTPRNEITRWNPANEIEEFQNRIRSLMNPDGAQSILGLMGAQADWTPAVDVSEDDHEFLITADLPDVSKENVKVTVEENILTIQGERKHESEETRKKFHRVERSIGRYARSFQVPRRVDCGRIEAEFDSGVLKVHLPKKEESAPSRQEIAVA